MANKIEEIALKHVPACEADESNALRAALLELLEGCCAVVELEAGNWDDEYGGTACKNILARLRALGGE